MAFPVIKGERKADIATAELDLAGQDLTSSPQAEHARHRQIWRVESFTIGEFSIPVEEVQKVSSHAANMPSAASARANRCQNFCQWVWLGGLPTKPPSLPRERSSAAAAAPCGMFRDS